ncbi:putative membrane protein [Marmoricola sp. OAE513]|uniref:hypothetical protein n=1 Tax=Marmoricola sp. OAE513 TaxID=2817894 RepID=UPI001AE65601
MVIIGSAIVAVVVLVLVLAWRHDRKRGVSADVAANATELQRRSAGEVQQFVPPRTLPPPP